MQHLAPGLWRVPTAAASCYVWDSAQGVVVVDPGLPSSAQQVLAAVRECCDPRAEVVAVLLTHWHGDHGGATLEVSEATGAPVLAGPADAAVLRGGAVPEPPALTPDERELYAAISSAEGVDTGPPSIPTVRDLLPDDPQLATLGVSVVAVGGHTPGSTAFHLPRVEAVLTGDVARTDEDGRLLLGLFHTDPPAAIAALRSPAQLGPRVAGPGHGSALLSGAGPALLAAALAAPAARDHDPADDDRQTTTDQEIS